MKALLLAGGYAKRLWPLTKETPKPLLEINGIPILEYIMKKVEAVPDVDEILISTNEKFGDHFKEFVSKRESKKTVKVFVEPTTNDENKLGCIGGLRLIKNALNINDDLLIVAGDNLFEFDLNDIVSTYKRINKSQIAITEVESGFNQFNRLVFDENNKITEFVEKPSEGFTKFIAICCYVLSTNDFNMIEEYLNSGGNPDSPGYFIEHLTKNSEVYSYRFNGFWFDVGTLKSLEDARRMYEK